MSPAALAPGLERPARVTDVRSAERSDPHLLSGWKTLLGELINSGARLRFFPHRAMMFLALAELADGGSDRKALLSSAEDTITDYRRIAAGIATDHRAFGVSAELSPWLSAMMEKDRDSFDHVVSTFTGKSLRILAALKRGGQDMRTDTIALSRFVATVLLDRMNKLVSDFTVELADVAKREEAWAEASADDRRSTATSQSTIIGLTDELNRVNTTVNIISLNATIQAAQAGDAGSGFALIASEIQKLSARIRTLTGDIRAALGGTGGP